MPGPSGVASERPVSDVIVPSLPFPERSVMMSVWLVAAPAQYQTIWPETLLGSGSGLEDCWSARRESGGGRGGAAAGGAGDASRVATASAVSAAVSPAATPSSPRPRGEAAPVAAGSCGNGRRRTGAIRTQRSAAKRSAAHGGTAPQCVVSPAARSPSAHRAHGPRGLGGDHQEGPLRGQVGAARGRAEGQGAADAAEEVPADTEEPQARGQVQHSGHGPLQVGGALVVEVPAEGGLFRGQGLRTHVPSRGLEHVGSREGREVREVEADGQHDGHEARGGAAVAQAAVGAPRWDLLRRIAGAVPAAAGGPGLRDHGAFEPGVHGGGVREGGAARGARGEEGGVEGADGGVVDDEGLLGEEDGDEEVEEEAEERGAGGAFPGAEGEGLRSTCETVTKTGGWTAWGGAPV